MLIIQHRLQVLASMSACKRFAQSSAIGSNAAKYTFEDMSPARPSLATSLEDAPHHSANMCKCCVGQENSWKQSLTIGKHGCSVCRHLFDASSWKPDTIKRHRSSSRDLVCARCSKRGYAPNKYQRYQCVECLDEFGFASS